MEKETLKETVTRLNALVSEHGYLIVLWQYKIAASLAIGFTQRDDEVCAITQTDVELCDAKIVSVNRVLTTNGEVVYDCHRSNSSSKS